MKIISSFSIITILSACSSYEYKDAGILPVSARALNANSGYYNGKPIYVSGYLNTVGNHWEFGITDRRHYRDVECLNIDDSDFLAAHRKQFDRKHVTLRGVFREGAWAGAWAACDNGNGIEIDEADLKARYGAFVCADRR
ncbi:hypothetical protein BH10PSE14_BH10PSE14_44950 [soil metagenome]